MSAMLSEEQVMIRDMARKFAEERLAPNAERWDEEAHFPVDILREAAALGFASIYIKDIFEIIALCCLQYGTTGREGLYDNNMWMCTAIVAVSWSVIKRRGGWKKWAVCQ